MTDIMQCMNRTDNAPSNRSYYVIVFEIVAGKVNNVTLGRDLRPAKKIRNK